MTESDETSIASAKEASDQPLVLTLRCLGGVDMLAFIAVVMPTAWIQWGHRWSGLGEFPEAPIASYLARSASAFYALHGLLVVYISFDVRRYWPLIRFFARLAVVHGVVMFAIDVAVGMPTWWTTVEGPAFAATGLVVLVTQYWGKPATQTDATGD